MSVGRHLLGPQIFAALLLVIFCACARPAAAGSLAALPIRPILLSPIVQITVSVPQININYGQSANVTVRWSGGTSPYTLLWYSGAYQSCQSDKTNFRNDSTSQTMDTIVVYPPASGAWYCVYIMDSNGQSALSPPGM